jgi:hypothetical protein
VWTKEGSTLSIRLKKDFELEEIKELSEQELFDVEYLPSKNS